MAIIVKTHVFCKNRVLTLNGYYIQHNNLADKHMLFPHPVEHSTLYYSVIQILITCGCGLKQNRPHLTSPSCDAGCGQMFTTYTDQDTQVSAAVIFLHTRVNSLKLNVKM